MGILPSKQLFGALNRAVLKLLEGEDLAELVPTGCFLEPGFQSQPRMA